jgi:hypothetical protein
MRTWKATFTVNLTVSLEEMSALIAYVDRFFADWPKDKWPTEEERVLLNALEALAAALPGLPS